MSSSLSIPADANKRNFMIKYRLDKQGYYLKDLGEGSGTFVKVDKPIIVSTGFLVSFGDSHLVADTFEDEEGFSHIALKFGEGPLEGKVL
jgi:hypothetical protein